MFKKGLLLGLALVATFCAAEAQDGSDVMNAEWTGVSVLCDYKKGYGVCKFKYHGKILYFDVYSYYKGGDYHGGDHDDYHGGDHGDYHGGDHGDYHGGDHGDYNGGDHGGDHGKQQPEAIQQAPEAAKQDPENARPEL
ncbi:hypothetical protein BGZ93_002129 [Podila epicladia]|nr:hypothetical protein BGZ92_000364 [Podila epicladia]KAG0082937.1 hypothetical protein BGZ93_002129 [Podila epicladia]